MLTEQQILEKIATWENQTTEFKREFSTDTIRKALVAFSNDYHELGGGVIIVGVDEKNHEIVGIDADTDSLMQRITGLCRDGNTIPSIAPNLYPVEVQGKILMIMEVNKSTRRPHRAQNICYIRIGTSNQRATPEEEFELIRRSGQIPFDLAPVRETNITDIDTDRFLINFLPRRVSAELLANNGRTAAQWLEHLKLAYHEGDRSVPTVAALLLFGKKPQDYFPHSSIDFIRFEGDDASYPIIDRKEIVGTLDQLVKIGVELVEQHTIQGYLFSNKSPIRTDIFEYPMRAIREAIANAVVHRDYEFSNSKVSIKMFDDRIEIFSPGSLFGIVTRENFGTGINDYRNPTLAVGLNIMGLVEKAGTGILNIKRQMRENGSYEPIFDIGDKYLITKLPAHHYYQSVRLYQKGLQALESGDRTIALHYLQKSTALYPNFAEAWAALGRLHALYNDISAAQKAFLEAIRQNPHFEKAYLDWARMEETNGDLERSTTVSKQGIMALPNSAILHYSLGMLQKRQRQWNNASQTLRRAAILQPDNVNILRSLGEVYLQQRYWKEATDVFQKVLAITDSDNAIGDTYLNLIKALIGNRADQQTIKNTFENALTTGFNAQELFSVYYRYLTQTQQHAEALRVQELAEKEGLSPLTPYTSEVNVSGFPNLPPKAIEGHLAEKLQEKGHFYSKINVFSNKQSGVKYAIIKTNSDDEAAKIIQTLNGSLFHNARLTAHLNFRR